MTKLEVHDDDLPYDKIGNAFFFFFLGVCLGTFIFLVCVSAFSPTYSDLHKAHTPESRIIIDGLPY